MIDTSTPQLISRSRARPTGALGGVAVTAMLAYHAMAAFDPTLPIIVGPHFGRSMHSAGVPPYVGVFLLALAVPCLGATLWLLRRCLSSTIDVVADSHGITANQVLWGRGRLAWSEITALRKGFGSMFHIHGVPQGAGGKARKLIIDLNNIDAPTELLEVINRYRPDLRA